MGFYLGDILVDRVSLGIAEDSDGLLYTLTHLSDAKIDITAEAKEAKDENGTLIKKFWKGKTGSFTANNAMLNLNIMQSSSGGNAEVTGIDNVESITMPKVIEVKSTSTGVTLTGLVQNSTVLCYGYDNTGTLGAKFEQAAGNAAASKTEFGLSTDGKFTPPTATGITKYIVKYQRACTSGAKVMNKADAFPGTIKLTLKVLAVDPCHPDTVRAGYVEMGSFQPSPEMSITFDTEQQLEYKGDLQVDYCSADKSLFNFYWADDEASKEA